MITDFIRWSSTHLARTTQKLCFFPALFNQGISRLCPLSLYSFFFLNYNMSKDLVGIKFRETLEMLFLIFPFQYVYNSMVN